MTSPLKPAFDWFLAHQDELVAQYRGRWVAIKDEKVLGDYEDQASAVAETSKAHEVGTFLVQKVEPGADSYTQSFRSRVAFLSPSA